MRSTHLSPWVPRITANPARALVAAALALLLALPAAATVRTQSVKAVRGATPVRLQSSPAVAASPSAAPAPISAGAWTQLGPFNLPGRMNGVTPRILNAPVVDALSDGYGFWRGYAWADAGWEEHGRTMATGFEQATVKLVFPPVGDYFERMTAACTDGSIRYSDDDGVSWSPVTVNLNDGRTLVPAPRKLLYSDHWSNVVYLLTRVYDPNADDTLFVFAWSFDSGASFDENQVLYAHHADAWVSQDGSSRVALAHSYDDGDDTHVQTMSEMDFIWSDTPASVPSSWGTLAPGLHLTAQCAAGDISRIWVLRGDYLFSSTDLGDTWSTVRDAWRPAGSRGLCASIYTPDLLVWTDTENSEYFGKLYVSADGGTTATWVNNDNSWGNPELPHYLSTNVDVLRWNFANTAHLLERRADGTSVAHQVSRAVDASAAPGGAPPEYTERFYVASGSGIYLMVPGDTTASLLTRNISNQQFNDVATLRNDQPFDTYVASRDNGLMHTYTASGYCDGYTAVAAGLGNDVSDVVTLYERDPADWTYWAQFPHSLDVIGGGGPFSGAFGEGYNPAVAHRMLVQDPYDWKVAYAGDSHLQRLSYDLGAGNVTVTDLTADIGSPSGGITGFGISPTSPSRWVLAMHNGLLLYSMDAGANWIEATGLAPAVMDDAQLRRVKFVFNPSDGNEVWCIGAGVLRSLDAGESWTEESAGLPSATTIVFDAAFDGTALNRLYLATAAGPFQWNGVSWTDLSVAGVPAVQFRSVEAVPYRGLMRFATWGAGLWDYNPGDLLAAPAAGLRELELAPRQNPVRGTGELQYSLQSEGQVSLELLDVAGRRVATLVDGVRPAGRAVASFDAGRMGAGVYFARLRTAGGTRTAKFVVTR